MIQTNEKYLHAIAEALLAKGEMTKDDLLVAVEGLVCERPAPRESRNRMSP